MNNKLKQKAKSSFEKKKIKLKNSAVFGKTIEYLRKCRKIKLVTTKRRINYLVSEPNYHVQSFLQKTY